MTSSADPRALIIVDTNILLAATDESRAVHAMALKFLNEDQRRLALTPQVVREYLVVATRPLVANGFGMTGVSAVANIRQFLDDMALLSEDAEAVGVLLDTVVEDKALGKQVHDANIVAVALAHGADAIVTDNVRHFSRFAESIAIEDLRLWT